MNSEYWQQPVQCARCGSVIHSRYEGQFVSCKCGAIAVDQTKYYERRIGNPQDFKELNKKE